MGADEGRAAGTSAIPLRSQRVSPDGGTIGKKMAYLRQQGEEQLWMWGKQGRVRELIITRKQGEKKVEWRKRGAAAKLRIFGSTTPDRKHQSL